MWRSNKNGRTVVTVVGIPHQSSLFTASRGQRGKKRLLLRPIGTTDERKTQPRPSRWPETRETRLTLAAHRSLHRALACTPTPPLLRMGMSGALQAASKPQCFCPMGAACMARPANRQPHHAHNRPRTVPRYIVACHRARATFRKP